MERLVAFDSRSGVALVVALNTTTDMVTFDFSSAAGAHDGHDLTVDQADSLADALLSFVETARTHRGIEPWGHMTYRVPDQIPS